MTGLYTESLQRDRREGGRSKKDDKCIMRSYLLPLVLNCYSRVSGPKFRVDTENDRLTRTCSVN